MLDPKLKADLIVEQQESKQYVRLICTLHKEKDGQYFLFWPFNEQLKGLNQLLTIQLCIGEHKYLTWQSESWLHWHSHDIPSSHLNSIYIESCSRRTKDRHIKSPGRASSKVIYTGEKPYRAEQRITERLEPPSDRRNIVKGEAFITLVRIISYPRVVEPRQKQHRPQYREENT